MRDVFACTKCNSIYEIERLRQQPLTKPRCQVCFTSFPSNELGDWLSYKRAEPEWGLADWLGVEVSQYDVPSPRQAFTDLAQRKILTQAKILALGKTQTADPVLQSSRLQPSAFSTTRVFDER